ncbi:probable basic-leucine zipper transcription factor Q [Formica exsecta]|uniref:probable basic-leucine zipper transcription factor Q n=1 Tax=Formica exsecta TaxID=72781 RepID=UPI0011420FD4|nr:probable basic-leucine zipper transcription factor Q [Formica exsecta]
MSQEMNDGENANLQQLMQQLLHQQKLQDERQQLLHQQLQYLQSRPQLMQQLLHQQKLQDERQQLLHQQLQYLQNRQEEQQQQPPPPSEKMNENEQAADPAPAGISNGATGADEKDMMELVKVYYVRTDPIILVRKRYWVKRKLT